MVDARPILNIIVLCAARHAHHQSRSMPFGFALSAEAVEGWMMLMERVLRHASVADGFLFPWSHVFLCCQ
jgi:hypothetical protein